MTGRTLLAFIALATSATCAAQNTSTHARLPAALAQAVAAFDRAQVAGDGPALARLLADDYVLVNSRAQIEHKADFINDYTAPGWKLMPYVVEDETVRSWNDGAVLAGVATLQGASGGKPFKARLRFADVWRRRGGKWQVIFTQAMREPMP
ncbi:MAG: nuclear transport factor 2 family protein [Rhodanobacter sp.]